MTWNELPQEYRDLKKTFDKEKNKFKEGKNNLIDKFHWHSTPQGDEFWSKCHDAETIDELPLIPGEKKSVEKEKTFEVVSFRSKIVNSIVLKLTPDGFYQKNVFDNYRWTYETLINDEDTEIYQVRKNYDNTVFTLGEETTNGVIKEFEISEKGDDMMVLVDNNWLPIYFINEPVQFNFQEELMLSEEQIDRYIGMNLKERIELTHEMSKRIYEEFKNKKNMDTKDKTENPKSNFNIQFDKTFFENIVDNYQAKNEGIKESEGKINVEYDWSFLKGQMNRMSKNKDKYPKNNWKKPMDIEQLKDAMFRHTLEVMNNNFEDDGDAMGHLYAISLNAMMIFTQLNNKK